MGKKVTGKKKVAGNKKSLFKRVTGHKVMGQKGHWSKRSPVKKVRVKKVTSMARRLHMHMAHMANLIYFGQGGGTYNLFVFLLHINII